ncbi:MAG: RidA family protein [Propionibacteriaceae bacterium]|nr:MAG: RidA family protein [Propionibacteriaceae bacterium]
MRETFTVPGAPPPAGHYSHAVRVGDVLYVSGQVPRDSAGHYEPADVATETRLTLTNLETIAAATTVRAGGAAGKNAA